MVRGWLQFRKNLQAVERFFGSVFFFVVVGWLGSCCSYSAVVTEWWGTCASSVLFIVTRVSLQSQPATRQHCAVSAALCSCVQNNDKQVNHIDSDRYVQYSKDRGVWQVTAPPNQTPMEKPCTVFNGSAACWVHLLLKVPQVWLNSHQSVRNCATRLEAVLPSWQM